jgi:hypothetical protein
MWPLSVALYGLSLVFLGWLVHLKKSAAAWLSLGMNLALMVAVLFLQLRGIERGVPSSPEDKPPDQVLTLDKH